jgi:predicted nucleic acid-binding Zn ribbon protein
MADYVDDCPECGAAFIKHRTDKQFCSRACHMRAYRRIQKDRLDLLESLIDRLPEKEQKILPDLFA